MSLEYDIYLQDVFTLAKTLVIKSSVTANAMNTSLIFKYGGLSVDFNTPTTWKYYLNISGEYHKSDTQMFIQSLDTQETILFSKDNLSANIATQESYMYGTSYYNSLVAKYPSQELLILGILYPVDINFAIDAKDRQILNYPKYLVEDQEYTLMRDLQTWVYNFNSRWDVPAFNYSDTLYAAAQLGIMYLNVVPKILNLRIARCKTIEAHSYHVNTYLASHNNLNVYIDYLTLKQKLFLYRNIVYLQKRSGFTSSFDTLVQKMLTDIGMPLHEANVKKLTADPDTFTSMPVISTKSINGIPSFNNKTEYSLGEIIDKELPMAYDNAFYYQKNSKVMSDKLTYTLNNFYKTKILLSSVVNLDNLTGTNLEEVLFSNLVYLSYFNKFNATVNLNLGNNVIVSMSGLEAVYLMIYINCKIAGFTLDKLPFIYISKALLFDRPALSDVLYLIDPGFISINTVYSDVVSTLPTSQIVNSINQFNTYGKAIFTAITNQMLYTSNISSSTKRAMTAQVIDRFYGDFKLGPTDINVTYATWLNSKGIYLDNYKPNSLNDLYTSLFLAATGYDITSEHALARTQKAVMSVINNLSSYSIQTIYDTVSDIVNVGSLAIRISEPFTTILGSSNYALPDLLGMDTILGEPKLSANGSNYTDTNNNPVFSYIVGVSDENISVNVENYPDYYSYFNVVPTASVNDLVSIY